MGYCMNQTGSSFLIKAKNVKPALQALKDHFKEVGDKSWVSGEEVMGASTFVEAMKACRWDVGHSSFLLFPMMKKTSTKFSSMGRSLEMTNQSSMSSPPMSKPAPTSRWPAKTTATGDGTSMARPLLKSVPRWTMITTGP